jgi:ankyrin repeat protein
MLLKAGADPHQKGKKSVHQHYVCMMFSSIKYAHAFRPLLRSPLHLACERGSLEVLQMFFDGGADPNFCDG